MQSLEELLPVMRIFQPYAVERLEKITSDQRRFVHYTTAEALINIIRSKSVWMRNATCMDDYTEIRHGLDCLLGAYRTDHGKAFKESINRVFHDISGEIEELFNGWIREFETNVYITCLSEHLSEEDQHGRLSMWRARGKNIGVAVVINPKVLAQTSDALKAYSSPVAYMSNEDVAKELGRIANNFDRNTDLLKSIGRESVKGYVFNAFMFAALGTKHPGFAEEREWRIIYAPKIHQSERLVKSVKIINGVPQVVYEIPLIDVPEEGLLYMNPDELFERIIIGPTEFPLAVYEGIAETLKEAGVKDPKARIFVSSIPLRV